MVVMTVVAMMTTIGVVVVLSLLDTATNTTIILLTMTVAEVGVMEEVVRVEEIHPEAR